MSTLLYKQKFTKFKNDYTSNNFSRRKRH
jgi:hypothetical protein